MRAWQDYCPFLVRHAANPSLPVKKSIAFVKILLALPEKFLKYPVTLVKKLIQL